MTSVLLIVALVAFLVVLFWLLSLPDEDDPEELLGMIAGNWHRFRP